MGSLLAVAALSTLAAPAAAQSTYTSESAFLAAIQHASTEDFEAVADGTTSVDWSYLGGTATFQGADGVTSSPCCSSGKFGDKAYQGWPSLTPYATFTSGVSAFGFYTFDESQPLTIRIFRDAAGTDLLDTYTVNGGGETESAGSHPFFFGVSYGTNTIGRVGLTQSSGDAVIYDNVTVGVLSPATSTTPEPVSMVLLGSGLVGLGVVRRRRGAKP
jgi:hypothetical protein